MKTTYTKETLEAKIQELKAGRTMKVLRIEDKKSFFKVQGLLSKLSAFKAESKGNFITKSDLTEYKGLIIWMMKNKGNYAGYMNLKEAMTSLLDTVVNENIVFKTRKSIKNLVARAALHAGLSNSEKNLRESEGLTFNDNTYNSEHLNSFTNFKLNALM